MRRQPISVFFILLFVLIIAGCRCADISYVEVESDHAKLFDGIESYQSPSEFKVYLSDKGLLWTEKQHRSFEGDAWKPPYIIYTVDIKDFSHIGFSGDLSVRFFNNRLESTRFYPLNSQDYIKALMRIEGITLDDNGEALIPPYLRIVTGRDYTSQAFVEWRDIRIEEEERRWVTRYE